MDVKTGQSRTGDTLGLVIGGAAKGVQRRLGEARNNLKPGEYLIPRFGANGAVIAYERPMASDLIQTLQRDTHAGRMLGVWSGRILEEKEANRFNREFVETMKQIHDQQGRDRKGEFVNIADPNITDPVIKDAWATLGWKIKSDVADVFGSAAYFPVKQAAKKQAGLGLFRQ